MLFNKSLLEELLEKIFLNWNSLDLFEKWELKLIILREAHFVIKSA